MEKTKQLKAKKVKKNSRIIIEIQDIVKNYGKTKVLKGISFNVKEGERIAIIGANGAGKSTLTEIISQIKEPTSGKIVFPLWKRKEDISKNLGIQFQESSYPMYFQTIDIINFFLSASKANISKEKLTNLIKVFHLEGIEKKYAQGLSGGQKQRLNVLLALIHSPEVMLLDEVSSGLDIEAREDIKNYINNYINENNSTLLLVSHNPDEIAFLTNRVIVIQNGKIFEDLNISEIKKKYKTMENYVTNLFIERLKKENKKIDYKKESKSKKRKNRGTK